MMQVESLNSLWLNGSTTTTTTTTVEPSPQSDNQPADLSLKAEQDELDVENMEEEEKVETPSRESPSSTSSASKRKSFMPQRIGEQLGIDFSGEPETINVSLGVENDEVEEEEEEKEEEQPSILQAHLNNPIKLQNDVFEVQKRLYNAFLEQQRKMMPQSQDRKIDYNQLVSSLKNEIVNNLTSCIEKVVKDWASSESAAHPEALRPMNPHPIFPLPHPNPLAAFNLHPHHQPNGGIFPPTFNAFSTLNAFNALRRTMEDEPPKKKKPKLCDSIKSEASKAASPFSDTGSPQITSVTPNLSRYFPPTMVGHHLYGGAFQDREDSPTNSDEMSDCGNYDSNAHSSTLTPMHLRKAKLMFFYTRYPNSNLLKSYFPDIRFNKNNTAQLVKWFSNFREFYYIQMEKFARQLLAEGVRSREEIFVSKESELFKALNTHYNRNNHIQPPDKLVYVVQESLREFFDAVRLGKDSEPSWKKTIYKVINRLDDVIPEYFKDPNFLDRLEA